MKREYTIWNPSGTKFVFIYSERFEQSGRTQLTNLSITLIIMWIRTITKKGTTLLGMILPSKKMTLDLQGTDDCFAYNPTSRNDKVWIMELLTTSRAGGREVGDFLQPEPIPYTPRNLTKPWEWRMCMLSLCWDIVQYIVDIMWEGYGLHFHICMNVYQQNQR